MDILDIDPNLHLPGTTLSIPCSQLNLIFKAERLKRKDLLTKSDPVCIVYLLVGRIEGHPEWKEIGRTERIRNTSEPEWAKQITVDYFFEERQTIRCDIYDWDTERLDTELSEHDFLGSMTCDLAEIVSAGTFTRGLGENGRAGTLTINCEETDEGCRETFIMNLCAEKLDKKDWGPFGKSDPYLQIYRLNDDGGKTMVHRTEVIRRTLNPTWKMFEINLRTLCRGDRNKPIIIECWDHDDASLSSHDFIGSCQVTAEEMLRSPELKKAVINDKKAAKKKSYSGSGILIMRTQMVVVPTFLDFIHGGTQLDFTVAVDFTASNGAVRKPTSLHFISEAKPNQYEIAIKAVLDICQHYNNSKVFDAYGFGARLSNDSKMVPVFALNDPKPYLVDPAVVGVSGVMRAYRHSLNNVILHGPTYFAPIINQTMTATAKKVKQDGSRYRILLIITDGAITDMEQTKKSIVDAAGLPLSIIIIGVGNDCFDKMDELDGDNQRICHGGRVAERDIVQFVPVRQFLPTYDPQAPTQQDTLQSEMVMAKLAKEILAEVPGQLISYMRRRNIRPRPASDPWPKDICALPQYETPYIAPTAPIENGSYPGGSHSDQAIDFNVTETHSPGPSGGVPYPGQAPYPQHNAYAPQAGPSSALPYPPLGPPSSHHAPYPPPQPHGYQENDHSFPYAPYPQEANQRNYNYPIYPQPPQTGHHHGHPNPIPLTVPYGVATAPPVSVDDVQMSFGGMGIDGQRVGYPSNYHRRP